MMHCSANREEALPFDLEADSIENHAGSSPYSEYESELALIMRLLQMWSRSRREKRNRMASLGYFNDDIGFY
ncbi:hypothetical protein TNCV_4802231 [Trichonephila clavipes]|nr:hypothetical protein TNCV_4802231 [Trichonephila clavipes]